MPKATKWTGEPVQQLDIEKRFRAGETVRGIAAVYACRTDLISDQLRSMGYAVARGRERIPADQKDALLEKYRVGATIRALAAEFGFSEGAVSALLGRAGVKNGKGSRWTTERLTELRRMYDSGLTLDQICESLRITRSALTPALRRAGVPPQQSRSRENHPSWKGGRVVVEGYIYVRPTAEELAYAIPNASGYVAEHRLVMGRELGRPLLATETVHHINGDRTDNDPTNLQLRQGQHGSGVIMTCNSCGSHDISSRKIR